MIRPPLSSMSAKLVMITLFVAFLLIGGCASRKPIHQQYKNELAQLQPGTNLQEFQALLPDAYVAGQNSVEGLRIDAYEVRHEHVYNEWYGWTKEESLWFFFHDGKLVKWGPPGSWPDKADIVVEQRIR